MPQDNRRSRSSNWNLHLATVFGIPIRVHLSFFLLPIWIFISERSRGEDALLDVLFILAVFACVLLHELGHSLAARCFDIKTRDITLYPFGGIASVLKDATPKGELIIALAGPAVNIVIAGVIFIAFSFSVSPSAILMLLSEEEPSLAQQFFASLFNANLLLAIFNMIPAFPMDGGRVLRALLHLAGVRRGTLIAARVSQVISICMVAAGVYWNHFFLTVIGMLIFSNASSEIFRERAAKVTSGQLVSDVMIDASQLTSLTHGMTVTQALAVAVRSLQEVFPVLLGTQVLGVIDKHTLMRASGSETAENYISEYMLRDFPKVKPSTPLAHAMTILSMHPLPALLVLEDEHFVGMIDRARMMELLSMEKITPSIVAGSKSNDADAAPAGIK